MTKRRVGVVAGVFMLMALGSACSSSDGGDAPAERAHAGASGAKASGGASGAKGGSGGSQACVPGATQACVGPAACNGGQICLANGTAWGACDCGAAGAGGTASIPIGGAGGTSAGAASSGGTAPSAGAADVAGAPSGDDAGTGGTSSGDDTSAAGASAGGDGGATGDDGPPPVTGPFDFSTAIVENSPADIATWAETATITDLNLGADNVSITFTKQDGDGRWPDVPTDTPGDSLQYTLWIVIWVDGQWYTSGCIEYWYGDTGNGGPPNEYAMNWYYAADRWGPMTGHQPVVGENVGFFVSAGQARNDGPSIVQERSNVVFVPFPAAAGADFTF